MQDDRSEKLIMEREDGEREDDMRENKKGLLKEQRMARKNS